MPLRSYPAAMRELGSEDGRHLNNRAENIHLPFRRRERAMLRFRQMKSLQKFATVHALISNRKPSATSSTARPSRPPLGSPRRVASTSPPEFELGQDRCAQRIRVHIQLIVPRSVNRSPATGSAETRGIAGRRLRRFPRSNDAKAPARSGQVVLRTDCDASR